MNIGLDFDGVISDCGRLKSDAAKKLFNKDIPSAKFKRELLIDGGLLTAEQYTELQKTIYGTREIGMLMEPIQDVLIYLPKIITEGHKVTIITSRGETSLEIAKEWAVLKNLRLNFIGVNGGNKADASRGLDLFIDDDLDKIEPLVGIVPHLFLFSHGYNEHINTGGIAQRIFSWKEFYEIISSFETVSRSGK
jgi:uncharacterized HAD superfamily protein